MKTIIDQTLYWGSVNYSRTVDQGGDVARFVHRGTPTSRGSKHFAVVKAARALLSDWSARRKKSDIQQFLTPEKHMITRRKKIREALESLPSWPDYARGTADVYGV